MKSLMHAPEWDGSLGHHPADLSSEITPNYLSFFHTIPPERIGLHGEYDHNGLAKRIEHLFREKVAPESLKSLRISQRGGVVVLIGQLSDHSLLEQLIQLAGSVTGTIAVEVHGIKLLDGTMPKRPDLASDNDC
jgi:hypothetical protein